MKWPHISAACRLKYHAVEERIFGHVHAVCRGWVPGLLLCCDFFLSASSVSVGIDGLVLFSVVFGALLSLGRFGRFQVSSWLSRAGTIGGSPSGLVYLVHFVAAFHVVLVAPATFWSVRTAIFQ